jgi:hypothetical protein
MGRSGEAPRYDQPDATVCSGHTDVTDVSAPWRRFTPSAHSAETVSEPDEELLRKFGERYAGIGPADT